MQNSLESFEKYGDRSSSLVSLYPQFESVEVFQFVKTQTQWFAGGEPLCENQLKASSLLKLWQQVDTRSLTLHHLPVGEALAAQFSSSHLLQIGLEPSFELGQLFSNNQDPLVSFAQARRCLRQGGEVQEIPTDRPILDTYVEQINDLLNAWNNQKGNWALHFLSKMEPWTLIEKKRVFVFNFNGAIEAALFVHPIPQAKAVYFADLLRSPTARHGVSEALQFEVMRKLYAEGIQEVRLGIVPLAHAPKNKLLKWLYQRDFNFYSCHSIFRYKSKLRPTHWKPLYWLCSKPLTPFRVIRSLPALTQVVLPKIKFSNLLVEVFLAPIFLVKAKGNVRQKGVGLASVAWTFSLTGLFLVLHLARQKVSVLEQLYLASGYFPKELSFKSIFLSSFFHNNNYHLFGNLLSLVFFGGLLELLRGKWIFLISFFSGFWLSNPLTHLILPTQLLATVTEHDWGSSNGVYAVVGSLAWQTAQPRLILMPFIMNALIICVSKQNWLSLHHIIGLALGILTVELATNWPLRVLIQRWPLSKAGCGKLGR